MTVPLEYERAVAGSAAVEKEMISTRRSGTPPANKPAGLTQAARRQKIGRDKDRLQIDRKAPAPPMLCVT
jgi:hypothetical protein